MKKLLFGTLLLLSVAAIHASSKTSAPTGYAFAHQNITNRLDTLPTDTTMNPTDTTTMPMDSLVSSGSTTWNNVLDSVPSDTTVKDTTGLIRL